MATTRGASLPMPGLLWGAYPERRRARRDGLARLAEHAEARLGVPAALLRHRYRLFTEQVEAYRAAWDHADDATLAGHLNALHPVLARNGLRGEALARAMALGGGDGHRRGQDLRRHAAGLRGGAGRDCRCMSSRSTTTWRHAMPRPWGRCTPSSACAAAPSCTALTREQRRAHLWPATSPTASNKELTFDYLRDRTALGDRASCAAPRGGARLAAPVRR
jgi:hypothetical protein